MTRYLIEQWKTGRRRQPRKMNQPRKVTLVTSAMARPVIEGFASDLRAVPNLEVQVVPIVNQFFGPEVTVAGLLCAQDVLKTFNEQENLGDLVLLPRVTLDNEGKRFLDDVTVEEFQASLPTPSAFVRNTPETVHAIRELADVDNLLRVV